MNKETLSQCQDWLDSVLFMVEEIGDHKYDEQWLSAQVGCAIDVLRQLKNAITEIQNPPQTAANLMEKAAENARKNDELAREGMKRDLLRSSRV